MSIKRQAAELASARRERLTTVHLLAAIASRPGPAAELLLDRHLDRDVLLKAGRSFDEDDATQLDRAVVSARELAKRARPSLPTDAPARAAGTISPDARHSLTEPGAAHLLAALLADRRLAAHRALTLSGVDVTRLRTLALGAVHGMAPPRRELSAERLASFDAGASASTRRSPEPRGYSAGARREQSPSVASASQADVDASNAGRARRVAPSASRATSVRTTTTASRVDAPLRSAPAAGRSTVVPLLPPMARGASSSPEASKSSSAAVSEASSVGLPASAPRNARTTRGPGARGSDSAARTRRRSGPAEVLHIIAPAASNDGEQAREESNSSEFEPTGVASAAEVGAIDRKLAPTLASLGTVVPDTARAVGREAEIERVLDVLAKHRANTPCLVGPAGVGKSTVARALAGALSEQGARLVEIRPSALVAGTGVRGAISERIASIFEETRKLAAQGGQKLVLWFDDVHELFCAGDEATSELKSALGRGDVSTVLATSTEGLRRSVETDAQLARRITPVEIEEPDEATAFFMLREATVELGAHHRASYSDEAIASAVSWSIRYLPTRALPDKALTALDEAGARARRMVGAAARGMIEVGRSEVARAVSELADVPVERLLETDRDRLLRLEEHLGSRVVGHTGPIARISAMLRKSAAGLRGKRPLGSFLLLGPTGVGKTETAKAIADALFGSSEAMTRIDMSEFSEAHAVARLLGAPPGYVGHEAGGQLTEAVRKRPYQVVLLDEIEKAHQDVLLSFLQVLDEGHLTDSRGRRVDFTNVVLVMTSNLGAKELASAQRARPVGFSRTEADPAALARTALDAAKRGMPIELYNRIDEVLFFEPLSRAQMALVARQMIEALGAALEARDVALRVEDDAIEALLESGGFEPELGARPMRRAVARLVEAPLAELLLRGELESGGVALVTAEDGRVVVDALDADAVAAQSA